LCYFRSFCPSSVCGPFLRNTNHPPQTTQFLCSTIIIYDAFTNRVPALSAALSYITKPVTIATSSPTSSPHSPPFSLSPKPIRSPASSCFHSPLLSPSPFGGDPYRGDLTILRCSPHSSVFENQHTEQPALPSYQPSHRVVHCCMAAPLAFPVPISPHPRASQFRNPSFFFFFFLAPPTLSPPPGTNHRSLVLTLPVKLFLRSLFYCCALLEPCPPSPGVRTHFHFFDYQAPGAFSGFTLSGFDGLPSSTDG